MTFENQYQIAPTNHNRSKQRDEPIRIHCTELPVTYSKRGKNRVHKLRLVLVLLLTS